MRNLQVNPMELILAIRNGQNPQQLMLKILEDNASSTNPIIGNLITLARNNRTQEIEMIARNLAKERGIDFDKEFNAFKNTWGLK
jgi:hypothetical protein